MLHQDCYCHTSHVGIPHLTHLNRCPGDLHVHPLLYHDTHLSSIVKQLSSKTVHHSQSQPLRHKNASTSICNIPSLCTKLPCFCCMMLIHSSPPRLQSCIMRMLHVEQSCFPVCADLHATAFISAELRYPWIWPCSQDLLGCRPQC